MVTLLLRFALGDLDMAVSLRRSGVALTTVNAAAMLRFQRTASTERINLEIVDCRANIEEI